MTFRAHVECRLGHLGLDVTLSSDPGPLVLVGPNGAGKTTLLRLIAGARRPDRGRIEIDAVTCFDSERGIDLPCEARDVGYVPQGLGLFEHLRVGDNVGFGLSVGRRRVSAAERQRDVHAMLDELECAHLAERFPSELSGGERQRVALARALVIRPRILLLDEPLAAMDTTARRRLRGFLAERLRSHGTPSVLVTHDVRDAIAVGGTVVVLEAGRVVQEGRVAELAAAPANDFVAELTGADLVAPPTPRPTRALRQSRASECRRSWRPPRVRPWSRYHRNRGQPSAPQRTASAPARNHGSLTVRAWPRRRGPSTPGSGGGQPERRWQRRWPADC
jgi:ABC-type sulfate/molybdate transport systems ATPase subunit